MNYDHEPDTQYLRRYYRHYWCKGCDSCWTFEKWTTLYARRKKDAALIETGERWRPLSATLLPLEDRAASLHEARYRLHDLSLLRAVNVHTGHYIMAFLLV